MRKKWPLAIAVALYAGVFAVQLCQIFAYTQGRQLYPLDDVYIHAAVAKNLLLHHVYGVTQFHYSFPSSSILWPFILALAFSVVGVKAFVPLALNFIFAVLYLVVADRSLKALAESISSSSRFACLLLLVFGIPLVGLSFEGMEHVLHALSILLLLYCYNREQVCPSTSWRVLLALAAVFAVGMRYESLFAVLMVALLLFRRRKWAVGLLVGFSSLIPAVAFGLFARAHGSTFLPAPLLLKTSSSTQTSLLTALRNLFSTYALLSGISACFVTIALLVVCFLAQPSQKTQPIRDLLLALLGMFVIHAQLAQFGWLFRYEAYLLATTVVLTFAAVELLLDPTAVVSMRFSGRPLKVAMVALLAAALSGRAQSMLRGIPRDAGAVYEQQYQTARFLATFYSLQAVGLNDIGAPDFFAEIRCVDLLGLASSDVAQLRRSGKFTRDTVARLAQQQGVRIAVLYPEYFANQIPYFWIPVSNMEVKNLPGKLQLGERRLTLYATNPHEARELARNIELFRAQLPPGVEVTTATQPQSGSPAPSRGNLNKPGQ
jgi:hypothetical protein